MAELWRESNSKRLRDEMRVTCSPLVAMYHRLWNHPRIAELFPSFLILMHQVIRASVPLMEAARSKAAECAGSDELSSQLACYLEAHIEEESNHDEWLLEDFDAAGLGRATVLAKTPSSSVAALVGAQYYWIHHHHPVALLGYIRLLEGNPPSVEHSIRLQEASGLPDTLFRTYRLHGQLDPDHLADFDAMLDSLPLTEGESELIGMSAFHTAASLSTCLGDLVRGLDGS